MKYTVYFELFGKKLKTTVEAQNEYKAKDKIRDAIKFHKIEAEDFDSDVIKLMDMFGMK